MTETLPSPTTDSTLTAWRLREERACAGYLAARKALRHAATRLASLRRLVAEQPKRADYRQAFYRALETYTDAAARTELAYNRYLDALVRTDRRWTATQGRIKAGRAA